MKVTFKTHTGVFVELVDVEKAIVTEGMLSVKIGDSVYRFERVKEVLVKGAK